MATIEELQTQQQDDYVGVYWWGLRRSAIIETLAYLLILTGISVLFFSGNRFYNVTLHPFWIIILLITVRYGTNEGLFAAFASSLFLLVGNLPEQLYTQDFYTYWFHIGIRPLLWFVTVIVLGALHDGLIKDKRELIERNKDLQGRLTTIVEHYEEIKSTKEFLETRLASQLKGTATAYQTVASVKTTSPAQILMHVEKIVTSAMAPNKFSVYALGEVGLESVACVGWEDKEPYKRRFSSDTELFRAIVDVKQALCVINANDEKILDQEGVLAAPLIDPKEKKVFGMLKIEELSFMELNLSNVQSFKALCEWIGLACTNAANYQEAQLNSLFDSETKILSNAFYHWQMNYLMLLMSEIGFSTKVISFRFDKTSGLTPQKMKELYQLIEVEAKNSLSKLALVFVRKKLADGLKILAPGVQEQKILDFNELITKKIAEKEYKAVLISDVTSL